MEAKKRKSGVNNTTVTKDRKKAARSQSVPYRAPEKKEKPKKKVTLSCLNGSADHPAMGITPSRGRNTSETLQLSYL